MGYTAKPIKGFVNFSKVGKSWVKTLDSCRNEWNPSPGWAWTQFAYGTSLKLDAVSRFGLMRNLGFSTRCSLVLSHLLFWASVKFGSVDKTKRKVFALRWFLVTLVQLNKILFILLNKQSIPQNCGMLFLFYFFTILAWVTAFFCAILFLWYPKTQDDLFPSKLKDFGKNLFFPSRIHPPFFGCLRAQITL